MRLRLPLSAPLAVVLLGAALLALDARPAYHAARSALRHLEAASAAAFQADPTQAGAEYRAVRTDLRRARASLEAPSMDVLARLPLIGRWVRTARELTTAGDLAARAGIVAADWWNRTRPALRVKGGGIDLQVLREGGEGLQTVQALLARAAQTVRRGPPPLTAYTDRFHREVTAALQQIKTARATMALGAQMLSGSRRYFLAMQTPSELRGTGGLIGTYGILEVRDGRMRLARFGRPREELPTPAQLGVTPPAWYTARYSRYAALDIWQNLNMTPDFPTTASLIAETARRTGFIGPVDGVIAMDPVAVAAILRLTGPVRVASWPEPISAGNAVEVMGNRAYFRYQEEDPRLDFLAEVTRAAWTKLFEGDLTLDRRGLEGLGGALAGRHIQLWSAHPQEQEQLRALDVTGELAKPYAFSVVSQNSSGNKIDFFLRRSVTYDIVVQPGGGAVTTVTVRLYNGAPSTGQPQYVIGNPLGDPPGSARDLVSIYAPAGSSLLAAVADGARSAAEGGLELGVPVFSHLVQLGPRSTSTFRTVLWTERLVDPSRSTATLDLLFKTQPLLVPDTVTVRVRAEGWTLEPRGGARERKGAYEWTFRHDRDVRIRAELRKR